MTSKKSNWIHFIGIGGAGMSGIAKVLLELGYQVSGSDLHNSEATERLIQNGAQVFIGHQAENVQEGVDTVVISSAIPEENSEIQKARQLKIPVIQRAEMLSKLMENQKAICIAGAHGKTTTTSMIASILEKNDFDPTIVVGGELNDIGGNAKLGRGEYLVAEADESDGSFLKLKPWATVITNIENDHLDHYKSLDKIIEAFRDFINLGSEKGFAVLCVDNPFVRRLTGEVPGKIITYGLQEKAHYKATNITPQGLGIKAEIYYSEEFLGILELKVPGKHNISNALAAIAVGRELGLSFDKIVEALKDFQGAQRRFQVMGTVNNIQVVDDYAHHPTEIKTTLEAARTSHSGRIITVFQPHRYTRTKFLAQEFAQSFNQADLLIFDDIYAAGEKPIPGVTVKNIIDKLPENVNAQYITGKEAITKYLLSVVKPGDLVLTLGAGDVWKTGVELLTCLSQQEKIKASV